MGASLLLPRLISQQRAAEYLLTGKTVTGVVAEADGLVLEAVDKVLHNCMQLLNQLRTVHHTCSSILFLPSV